MFLRFRSVHGVKLFSSKTILNISHLLCVLLLNMNFESRLEKGRPMLVCGNTAAMLGEDGISWLSQHFDVIGDRSVHFGLFGACGSGALENTSNSNSTDCNVSGGCC